MLNKIKAIAAAVWAGVKKAALTAVEYFIGAIKVVKSKLTLHAAVCACIMSLAIVSPVTFAYTVVIGVFAFGLSLPGFLALDMWTYHKTKKAALEAVEDFAMHLNAANAVPVEGVVID